MIKVSIIVPIYNMEKYLAECLNSMMNQTLQDIEIICINDGSTDGSLDILKLYQQENNKIKILNQSNCGVAAARNRGIEMAQGEFIAFMDPDDYYPSDDVLELLYNMAKSNKAAACGGSLCYFSEGQKIYKMSDTRKGSRFEENGLIEYDQYQYVYGFQRFIYEREVIIKNHIKFPPYIRFQDPPFMLDALAASKKLFVISEVVYCLRSVDKKISYSNERIMLGIAKGLQDLLRVSLENDFMELYKHTVNEIFTKYAMRLYNHVLRGSGSIENEIIKINNLLETKLMSKKTIFSLAEEKRMVLREFNKRLGEKECVIIYGAAQIGKEVYDYISKLFLTEGVAHKIKFAVTNLEDDASTARGEKIYRIEELTDWKENAIVVLATQKNFWSEIGLNLEERGFGKVIGVDIDAIRLLEEIM